MAVDGSSPSSRAASGLAPHTAWLAVLGVWLGLQSILAVAVGVFHSAAGNVLVLGACEVLVLGGASLALAYRRSRSLLRGHVDRNLLAVGPASIPVVCVGLAAGVAIHPLANAIREGVEQLHATPPEQLERKLALLSHDRPLDAVVLFVVIGVLGPLVEELFYRGVLFTRVRLSRGAVAAGWLSGVGFVFAHGDVRDWPSLLLVSLLITWLRARSGSIWAGAAAHAGFNCATLALLVWAPALEFGGILVGLGALAALGLLVLATHITRNDA